MKEIIVDIPNEPSYFWYVCQAPPAGGDVKLIDLAFNHDEFIGVDRVSGKRYIIERLDFFIYGPGQPIPFFLAAMALNMNEKQARSYLDVTYKEKQVVFFFFKIKK